MKSSMRSINQFRAPLHVAAIRVGGPSPNPSSFHAADCWINPSTVRAGMRFGSTRIIPAFPCSSFSSSSSRFFPSPLVTANWVNSNLSSLKLLDGSWHMPAEKINAKQDFLTSHIPTAQFFDLDLHSDHSSSLPHMMPPLEQFMTTAKELGLKAEDRVVVYDTKGVFSSPRVWFTLQAFGMKEVAVLNGGLPSWVKHGFKTESGPSAAPAASTVGSTFLPTSSSSFTSPSKWIANYKEVLSNSSSSSPSFLVLDARSTGRFTGIDPEPRAGLKSGHIPQSLSIPYASLVGKDNEEGIVMIKKEEELKKVFAGAGIDVEKLKGENVVASCGTGVTACTIALSLTVLGHKNWRIYDGSWTEWAQIKDAPIHTGPATPLKSKS